MGTVRVHNSVAANITVKLTGADGSTEGKCSLGHEVALDLNKMSGWKDNDQIKLSVKADGGVTRHNTAGQFHPEQDYRYKVHGSLDAFSVTGPE
jgi:hypothetical protein